MKWWERILEWLVNALHTLGFVEKDPPQMRPALFILQPHHVREGLDLSPYGLIVCNPSIDPATIKCAKDTLLFAYVCAHTVPQYEAEFYAEMRREFKDWDYAKDEAGDIVAPYPNQQEIAWTKFTADKLAEAVVSNYFHEYAGFYVDELWAEAPPRIAKHHEPGSSAAWHVYSNAFVEALRDRWPGLIIANVGRQVSTLHWDLDGVTVESTHVKTDADWRRLNDAMSHFPKHYCVAWEWNAQHVRNGEIMRDG